MSDICDYHESCREERHDLTEEAERLCQDLYEMDGEEPSIRLVVAGGFSAGKSAFINHYLGRKVAAEGVTATTRSCTEYVYGPADSYTADGEEVSREEYLNLSKEEGTRRKFVVTLASDKLDGITLIDTPGIGNEQQETDFAKQAIYSANILLWLVNINDGTIKDTDLTVLKDAMAKAENVPLAFLLTFADKHPKKKIEAVSEEIQGISNDNGFRVPYRPLPFSAKTTDGVMPSVREFIERQEDELTKILADCQERQCRNWESRRERLLARLKELEGEFEESKNREIGKLEAYKRDIKHNIKNRKKSLKGAFERKIRNALKTCLDETADDPPLSAITLKEVPNTGLLLLGGNICNAYEASFCRSGWNTVVGNRLAKSLEPFKTSTAFYLMRVDKWEKVIADFVSAFGNSLSQNIQNIRDDSFVLANAKDEAQRRMRNRIGAVLRQYMEEHINEIERMFLNGFWATFHEQDYRWEEPNLNQFQEDEAEVGFIIGEVQAESFPKYEEPQSREDQPQGDEPQPIQHRLRSPIRKDWYVISGIFVGWAGVHLAYIENWGGYCLSMLLLVISVWTSSWKIHLWHNISVGLLLVWWLLTFIEDCDGNVLRLRKKGVPISRTCDDAQLPSQESHSPKKRIVYALLSILLGTLGFNGRYIRSRRENRATRTLVWSLVFAILLYSLFGSETWTPLICLNIIAMFMWNIFCALFVDEDGDGRQMKWF